MELSFPHLRYFWVVAREGNLTRAARKLRVTQSAVSVQIKKLEASLGRDLFERKGRSLELTDAGRLALDYAESIFTLGDELLEALEHEEERARQTLEVGVRATLSRNFQVALLGPLLDRKEICVRVRSGAVADLIQRLIAHELDLVLCNSLPGRSEREDWVAHVIDEQPVSLIGHPDACAEGASLAELLDEASLVVPSVESGIRMGFDALVERLGVKPRIHAEVDDMAMLRLVARRHGGLSVIPPIVVRDEIAAGTLVEHRQLPGIVEPFIAITAPRKTRKPLLDALGIVGPSEAG